MLKNSLLIILLFSTVGLATWYEFNNYSTPAQNRLRTTTLLSPHKRLPNFSLIDTHNKIFTEEAFLGHWTVLFFGYADCPDICPATLSLLKETWRHLPKTKSIFKPQVVFASINPMVDNLETLRKFINQFNPDFIGITGDYLEMQKLATALNIYAKSELNKQGQMIINHSSSLLIINPKAELHAVISSAPQLENLVHDLNYIFENHM